MLTEGCVDRRLEGFVILREQSGAFCKRDADRAVAALVDRVTGGLIAQKVDVDVVSGSTNVT